MDVDFSIEARRRIAGATGVSEPYLYQCLTGRRDMNPAEARRIEAETGGEVKRWHLCQRTWAGIWPELIGIEGAPPVPVQAKAETPNDITPDDKPLARFVADAPAAGDIRRTTSLPLPEPSYGNPSPLFFGGRRSGDDRRERPDDNTGRRERERRER